MRLASPFCSFRSVDVRSALKAILGALTLKTASTSSDPSRSSPAMSRTRLANPLTASKTALKQSCAMSSLVQYLNTCE